MHVASPVLQSPLTCWLGLVAALTAPQEHARDSFENLLFSLCRFHEITGRYPARITAVSYTLKQKRFEQLHRAAVRFPAAAFSFIGTQVNLAGLCGVVSVFAGGNIPQGLGSTPTSWAHTLHCGRLSCQRPEANPHQ